MSRYGGTVGVYSIRNIFNDKMYIGSSVDTEERWKNHIRRLNNKTHSSIKLLRAWEKYGGANFEFKLIETCSINKLIEREQFWLDFYSSYSEKGYNINLKANSCLGVKRRPFSLQHRQKISESKSGPRNPNFGKHRSEETKKKISTAQIGIPRRKPSEETRKLRSTSLKKYYKQNGVSEKHIQQLNYARKLRIFHPASEETKKRMSVSQLKRTDFHPASEETKKRISIALIKRFKNFPRKKSSKKNIKEIKPGCIFTKKKIAKISRTLKARHEHIQS